MKVTVMMAVYNGEKYIRECLNSVLNQTYADFEFLILDDGSTDHTCDIIRSFKDSRIYLLENEHDYIASLNRGLKEAKGELIARMDADDIMLPERLKRQVTLMENQPDVDVCASWCNTFGRHNIQRKGIRGAVLHPMAELINGNIFCHSTVMLRKGFLHKYDLSYKRYDYAEDYKLWCDIAKLGGRFYVIPEPLIKFRLSDNQVSFRNMKEQKKTAGKIQNELLEAILLESECPYKERFAEIFEKVYALNRDQAISGNCVRLVTYLLYKDLLTYNMVS